jgi:putative ABC transport system permease protein
MSALRVMLSRILDVVLRRRRDERLSDEIKMHLDLLTDEYVAKGMSSVAARQAARRAFGGVEQMKEAHRDQRGLPFLDTVTQDLRFALRLLVKDRRFTAATIVTLGLGIGVNNSVFALINTVMIRDLPFYQPDRLVRVGLSVDHRDGVLSYPEFVEWRRSTTTITAFSALMDGTETLADEGRPAERVRSTFVSAGTFRLFGRSPIIGRDFREDDDVAGAPPVVILGYNLWRNRYNSDPTIVGRTVRINEIASTVIGVMPPRFTFPLITQLYQPLSLAPALTAPGNVGRNLRGYARLLDSAELSQARGEIETIDARLRRTHTTGQDVKTIVTPLNEGIAGNSRSILFTLMGVVALVLLIACANVASLLLARSTMRSQEIAIRAALGATRWRIVRQLLIECFILSICGGILGITLSTYGSRILATGLTVIEPGAAPEDTVPYWLDLSLNGFAYAFAGLLCLIASLGFGLLPALHISKTNVNGVLKEGGRGTTQVRGRRWTAAFVVAQLALTLVLLTGAGLLWRSFLVKYRSDVVVDPTDVVVMRLTLHDTKYKTAEQRRRFLQRLDDRLSTIAGVSSAAFASDPQFGGQGGARQLAIAECAHAPGERAITVPYVSTGSHYFETLRIPIIRGRALNDADSASGREGVVLNERFVSQYFPDEEDAIGRRLRLSDPVGAESAPWLTIVGVAKNIPGFGRPGSPAAVVYLPFGTDSGPPRSISILARGSGFAAVTAAVREQMRALDGDLALYAIEPLDTAIARSRYPQRLLGIWFGILAAIALTLASVGLYALTAHGVTHRIQEIGVRMALGAPARRVIWLFVRGAIVQLSIALVLGVAGALTIGRFFEGFLVQIGPRDLVTILSVTTLLVLTALAATFFPARRAALIDPAAALRAE